MASKNLLAVFILLSGRCFVHSLDLAKSNPSDVRCGQVSGSRRLNLVTPSGGQMCNYSFKPYNRYVCQLRVDFSTNLPLPVPAAPGAVPTCPATGYIQIGRFRICGVSTDQHLYIPFDGSNSQNRFIITTYAGSGTYQIKVTQVACPRGRSRSIQELTEQPQPKSENSSNPDEFLGTRTSDDELVAPNGCDQYFTSSTGYVESFNWNSGQGPYPGNTKYNVCFKKPFTSSKLQLFAQDFDLEFNDAVQTGTSCYDANGTPGFATDYIYSPLSNILETGVSSDYYCGSILKGKTLESTLLGLYWFTFNSGQYTGVGATKRIFNFFYNVN